MLCPKNFSKGFYSLIVCTRYTALYCSTSSTLLDMVSFFTCFVSRALHSTCFMSSLSLDFLEGLGLWTLCLFLSYFWHHVSLQHVMNYETTYYTFVGHGGARAAQYCKDHLLNYVLNDPLYIQDPSAAMTNAFVRYCTSAHFLCIIFADLPLLSPYFLCSFSLFCFTWLTLSGY